MLDKKVWLGIWILSILNLTAILYSNFKMKQGSRNIKVEFLHLYISINTYIICIRFVSFFAFGIRRFRLFSTLKSKIHLKCSTFFYLIGTIVFGGEYKNFKSLGTFLYNWEN